MKPALPAVVTTSPVCCSKAPAQRTSPAQTPPTHSADSRQRALSPRRARGSMTRAPSAKRAPVNSIGPIDSMPTRWATKALPQMRAVSNNRRSAFSVLDFMVGTVLQPGMRDKFVENSWWCILQVQITCVALK